MSVRYCSAPGCPNLVPVGGKRFCPTHDTARSNPANAKTGDPFYTSRRWRRYRDWYLAASPLCEHCRAAGLTVKADVVDHIVELSDGGDRFNEDNTQALCNRCHAKKTAVERARRAKNHQPGSGDSRRVNRFAS